jgi:phosphosulfolactate synthase (CoM biosynthesis protein A)
MSCMLLEIDCFLMFWCPFCAQECKELGFDAIELSTDFIHLPEEDLLRLIRSIKSAGLKARPELGIESANDVMILSTWLMVKCH